MARRFLSFFLVFVIVALPLLCAGPVHAVAPLLGAALLTNPYFLAFVAVLTAGGIYFASTGCQEYLDLVDWWNSSGVASFAEKWWLLNVLKTWVDAQQFGLQLSAEYLGSFDDGWQLGVVAGNWTWVHEGGVFDRWSTDVPGSYFLGPSDALEVFNLLGIHTWAYVSSGTATIRLTWWNLNRVTEYTCDCVITGTDKNAMQQCYTTMSGAFAKYGFELDVISVGTGVTVFVNEDLKWINTDPSPDIEYSHHLVPVYPGPTVTDFAVVEAAGYGVILGDALTAENVIGVTVEDILADDVTWAVPIAGVVVLPGSMVYDPASETGTYDTLWGILGAIVALPGSIALEVGSWFVPTDPFADRWDEFMVVSGDYFPFSVMERVALLPSAVFTGTAECLTFDLPYLETTFEVEACPPVAFAEVLKQLSRWGIIYLVLSVLYGSVRRFFKN